MVEGAHFDFILLDMLLGGMSGIDFLQSADLMVKSPQTQVIGFSNIGSDTIKERAKTLGVVDFLDKVDYDPIKLGNYLKQLPQPQPQSPLQ
jgi:CheY-like chemotaxis protein